MTDLDEAVIEIVAAVETVGFEEVRDSIADVPDRWQDDAPAPWKAALVEGISDAVRYAHAVRRGDAYLKVQFKPGESMSWEWPRRKAVGGEFRATIERAVTSLLDGGDMAGAGRTLLDSAHTRIARLLGERAALRDAIGPLIAFAERERQHLIDSSAVARKADDGTLSWHAEDVDDEQGRALIAEIDAMLAHARAAVEQARIHSDGPDSSRVRAAPSGCPHCGHRHPPDGVCL